MSDLISRADAIEAVHRYFVNEYNNEPHEIDEDGDDIFTDMKSVDALLKHNKQIKKAIKDISSVELINGDLISRDMAITAITAQMKLPFDVWKQVVPILKALPSADAVKGGDAVTDYTSAPMQQSRHDDGRMTREEAIYRLKNMAWLYGSAEREQNIEAIDMAIEALSADAVQGECDHCVYKWDMRGESDDE